MDTVSNEEYQLAVAFITDEYQTLSAVLPDPAQLDRLIALQTLIEKGPCNVKPPSFTDAQARKKWYAQTGHFVCFVKPMASLII
jgi:hypothetical protein